MRFIHGSVCNLQKPQFICSGESLTANILTFPSKTRWIGTDSQVKGDETEFATVIVFLREHNGGFMYIHNEKTRTKFHIKERMLVEVARSIEIAYELCDLFIVYGVDMEVHADINTNPQFKSNDALKEAMGYILGMGFAFKAKPEAFASSCCADKVCN